MWLWWRDGRPWPVGLIGAIALVAYGIIPTYQAAHFGRVYAAYGGVFVVLSVLWGWAIDGTRPDRYDVLGALICVLGVAVMMYAPRGMTQQGAAYGPPEPSLACIWEHSRSRAVGTCHARFELFASGSRATGCTNGYAFRSRRTPSRTGSVSHERAPLRVPLVRYRHRVQWQAGVATHHGTGQRPRVLAAELPGFNSR